MKSVAIFLALILPPALYFPTLGTHHDAAQRRADDELRDISYRVEASAAAQRKLTQFHEEVTRLATELAKLRVILPPDLAIDDVRSTLASLATSNNVQMTRYAVGKPQEDEDRIERIAMDVEVTGTAANIAAFLQRVTNSARIYDETNLVLRRDPAGWRASFVVTAYALRDAPAAPAQARRDQVADATLRR